MKIFAWAHINGFATHLCCKTAVVKPLVTETGIFLSMSSPLISGCPHLSLLCSARVRVNWDEFIHYQKFSTLRHDLEWRILSLINTLSLLISDKNSLINNNNK